MREPENIRAVEALHIDWMGFIFLPASKRFVAEKPAYLPEKCKRVGVFVNASLEFILQKASDFQLNVIQLHGQETPDFVLLLRQRVPKSMLIVKVIPVALPEDFQALSAYEPHIDYFLFETKVPVTNYPPFGEDSRGLSHYGGSGQQFDWQLLQNYTLATPFLLTGGITPDDAPRIRQITHPAFAGIDLNSRFEQSPGLKNPALIQQFLQQLKNL